MSAKLLLGILACCGFLAWVGQDELAGIKCVMKGDQQVKKETAVKYADGEVYFCCNQCASAFAKDPAKNAVKANHQLVATGQYVQKACPFSGQPMKDGVTVDVGGVEVGFCCESCQKKVNSQTDLEAKANLVFTDAAFKKSFEKKSAVDLTGVKCIMMPRDVKADQSVEYREGSVYFCCANCKKKYAGDAAKYAVKANQQLIQTGQYVQKACPITGRPVDDAQSIEIGGSTVKFCCGNCKKKVEDAADDNARTELLFVDAAFDKGFEKQK